jgi:hypothetical protein
VLSCARRSQRPSSLTVFDRLSCRDSQLLQDHTETMFDIPASRRENMQLQESI